MNIVYRKDKLYVYLESHEEGIDSEAARRLDNIMKNYDIEDLVIEARGKSRKHLHEFEKNYNSKHKSNVIIKN